MSLPTPRTAEGRRALAALVADPSSALVALDFDGTLAPIVDDPAQAVADPGAADALARLAARVRAVAVVTGRPAQVAVDRSGFGGVAGLADLVVLGHYGLERWDARTQEVSAPEPHFGLGPARADVDALDLGAGVGVEDKGRSFAVHTRGAGDAQGAFDRLRPQLAEIAQRHDLALEPGRLVLELRPPGIDKGGALRGLAEDGRVRTVVFVGDDLGDLAAFDEVERLRAGGREGLTVCSASGEAPEVERRADLVVDGPAGVVELLEAVLRAAGGPDA